MKRSNHLTYRAGIILLGLLTLLMPNRVNAAPRLTLGNPGFAMPGAAFGKRLPNQYAERVMPPVRLLPTSSAAILTTLYSFAGTDGEIPLRNLIQGADGNIYGTTESGGASSDGTVFKITPAGALTTLYAFSGADGADPYAGLVQGADGNFYGTTEYGGNADDGTVFKITPTGALTTLYAFSGTDGAIPYAVLVQDADGNFY